MKFASLKVLLLLCVISIILAILLSVIASYRTFNLLYYRELTDITRHTYTLINCSDLTGDVLKIEFCSEDMKLYILNKRDFYSFQLTGELPRQSVKCLGAYALTSEVYAMVIVDKSGGGSEYSIGIYCYDMVNPYFFLSIPSAVLAMAGIALLVYLYPFIANEIAKKFKKAIIDIEP